MKLAKKTYAVAFALCLVNCQDPGTKSVVEPEYAGSSFDLLWENTDVTNSMKFVVTHNVALSSTKTIGEISSSLVGELLQTHSLEWTVPEGTKHHQSFVFNQIKGDVGYVFEVVANDADFEKISAGYNTDKLSELQGKFKGYRMMVVRMNKCYLVFDAE